MGRRQAQVEAQVMVDSPFDVAARHPTWGPQNSKDDRVSVSRQSQLPKPGEALPAARRQLQPQTAFREPRPPIKALFPEGLEVAAFGLGCFWGAERKFW